VFNPKEKQFEIVFPNAYASSGKSEDTRRSGVQSQAFFLKKERPTPLRKKGNLFLFGIGHSFKRMVE